MSDRKWVGVVVRGLGLWCLAWSLESLVAPVERLRERPPTGRALTLHAATPQSDAVAAGWKVVVSLFLLKRLDHVVRFADPDRHGACPA